MQSTFQAVAEARPGPALESNIRRFWPAYRRWLLAGGGAASAGTGEAVRALRARMPELLPTFERLVELGPDDPLFPRFLTLYRPPPFIGACSMAMAADPQPLLVRNYDFDPALAEGVILETAWRGRKVLGMADCLWGLVDGLNEDGLAVALTFGGRRETGDGFGIPLILRYVLETARDVPDALEALRAVPSHAAYNVGVVDRSGRRATVHLFPGGGARVVDRPVATNHQDGVHWPSQARFTATLEREAHLISLMEKSPSPRELADAFLTPPLYRTQYGSGFGTLYTARLDPRSGTAVYCWPGQELACKLGELECRSIPIDFVEGEGARPSVRHRPAGTRSTSGPFECALESVLRGLVAAGRAADPELVADLHASGEGWARLGELFAR